MGMQTLFFPAPRKFARVMDSYCKTHSATVELVAYNSPTRPPIPRSFPMSRSSFGYLCASTAAAVLFLLPVIASAGPITFTFSGTVTVVNPLLASRFAPGDLLTGSLTYDSALADTDAGINDGFYSPLSSLVFTVDGYSPTFSSGSGFVDTRNGVSDQLVLRGDVTGQAVNFFRPFNLQLSLLDATGQALSSDDLPLAFSTSQFTTNQFFFTFTNRANPYDLTSGGTNFTGLQGTFTGNAASAPEPGALALLGTALFGAGVRRWRRKIA